MLRFPMGVTLDDISTQIFVLPAEQRMSFALALLESVEVDRPAAYNESWAQEISRRITAYDSGQTKTVPASDVFRHLREIAPDR